MRGPDGTIYPMKGVFHEISEPRRLVFTSTALEDAAGKPLLEILNTMAFDDYNGLTKLTLHARLITQDFQLTPEVAAALSGMEQGWSESLYRLADELDNSLTSAPADREMVITRVINAPRALVSKLGPNLGILGIGGAPAGLPLLRIPWTSGPAANGDSSCTVLMAPTTKIGLSISRSSNPSASFTTISGKKATREKNSKQP